MRIEVTEDAQEDRRAIIFWLNQQQPALADRFLETIRNSHSLLEDNPYLGRQFGEDATIRQLFLSTKPFRGRYGIIYQYQEQALLIVILAYRNLRADEDSFWRKLYERRDARNA